MNGSGGGIVHESTDWSMKKIANRLRVQLLVCVPAGVYTQCTQCTHSVHTMYTQCTHSVHRPIIVQLWGGYRTAVPLESLITGRYYRFSLRKCDHTVSYNLYIVTRYLWLLVPHNIGI